MEIRPKCVRVTMAWLVIRLRLEKRLPLLRVVNRTVLNKQSRTADKRVVLQVGVCHGADSSRS